LGVITETGRFGQLTVGDDEVIRFPQGLLGFPDLKEFCLIDPGDETLILWLQSLQSREVAFPVLEPKIFRPDYTARLSAAELRELKLENINQSAVFTILTIPEDILQMTSNLKAPVVVNLKEQLGRQVVLQENEYSIKHLMFRELRQHLITIRSQQRAVERTAAHPVGAISIKTIPPSLTVKSLQA
jgi:flagellar assembly factor FliW